MPAVVDRRARSLWPAVPHHDMRRHNTQRIGLLPIGALRIGVVLGLLLLAPLSSAGESTAAPPAADPTEVAGRPPRADEGTPAPSEFPAIAWLALSAALSGACAAG